MDYKERISEEAERLFMKYGIRAVTMDTIAHELGMSKRTIYENFSDKDSLLAYVIKNKAKKQKAIFHEIMNGSENVIAVIFRIIESAFDQMRNANPIYLIDLKKYHNEVFRLLCDRGDLRNSEMSLAVLARGVTEKIFRDDINIDLVNEGIQVFIDSTHSSEVLQSNKYSRYEIIDNLLISYLIGISTEKGIKLINKYKQKIGTNNNG